MEKDGPNDKKRRQARGLLDYLKDFDFCVSFTLDVNDIEACKFSITLFAKERSGYFGGHVRGKVNQAKISAN